MNSVSGERCSVTAAVAAIGYLLFAQVAAAQQLGVRGGVSPLDTKGRFALIVENDLFNFSVGESTDRFYSNGLYLSSDWSSPWLRDRTRDWSFAGLDPAGDRAYLGFGMTHELHTPETINPCGVATGDPLATASDPRQVDLTVCQQAENDWRDLYAAKDRPFSAVWSFFVSAQRYWASSRSQGAFTELRGWLRVEGGSYGSDAARGYEVQKHWHAFFNEALLGDEDDPAATPRGWRLGVVGDSDISPLVQVTGGADLSLFRFGTETCAGTLGVELRADGQVRAIAPRNDLSAHSTLLLGLLPVHSSQPLPGPGEYQRSQLYVHASAGGRLVITDMTQGDFDRYRHLADEYSLGLQAKFFGLGLALTLNWERILFINPLRSDRLSEPISDAYHRYGRIALEFSY